MPNTIIQTERLLLAPLSPTFLSASLHGDPALVADFAVPDEWLAERALIEMRLNDLAKNPAAQPWLLRAIIRRDTQQMIGHIGFHTMPDPEYLQPLCPGAVEFGYTVYPAFRRQGYAREATVGLLKWAHRTHGVVDFIASADPNNLPSVTLLQQLGFERIGGHMDEVDGYEDIFRRHVATESELG